MTRASPSRVKRKTAPAVTLTHPEAHPLMLATNFNAEMRRYELVIVVGNFESPEAATAYADQIIDSGFLKNARRVS